MKTNGIQQVIRAASLVVLVAVLAAQLVSCSKKESTFIPPPGKPAPDGVDFRQEMRNFVQGISTYARGTDADFIVIPQNGIELITDTGMSDGALETDYLAAIDGTGQEDLYYGYNADNRATPADVTAYLLPFLDIAEGAGKQVLAIDYCSTPSYMDDSYTKSETNGYISFAADRRELDNIPDYPSPIFGENSDPIATLGAAKNFLYLINPSQFNDDKGAFLNAIKATNYDIVLIDLFFNDGTALTPTDVTSLKTKDNGGTRLVICYMSIGEAENYRFYWQSGWRYGNPEWLDRTNPNWPGNFKVRYWDPDWQAIIFGNLQTNGHDSYLKQILDAGFDGVYLDIIDAFDYWENHW